MVLEVEGETIRPDTVVGYVTSGQENLTRALRFVNRDIELETTLDSPDKALIKK